MKSESIKELATALAKAQSQLNGAKKDSSNPYFKSNYADLSSVWEACRDALTKNNLSVIQTTETNDKGLFLITTLAHGSGEWISGSYPVKPQKEDPQALLACVTYARRGALAAIVGVCPVDDDGEAAMNRPEPPLPFETQANQAKTPFETQANQAKTPFETQANQAKSNDLSRYVIPFGKKHKGKLLKEVSPEDLASYSVWLQAEAEKKKEPLSGRAQEFVENVERFLKDEGYSGVGE